MAAAQGFTSLLADEIHVHFSGEIAAGTFDFQGIAAHEISEVMGRIGLSGGTVGTTTNSFSLIDSFSFTGPGTRGLRGGPGENFSIDGGNTLLKLCNDPTINHLDSRDWASGTNDAFNQFSGAGLVNPISAIDLQLMDVLGYDFVPIAGQLLSYGDAGTSGMCLILWSLVLVGGWISSSCLLGQSRRTGPHLSRGRIARARHLLFVAGVVGVLVGVVCA